MVLCCRALSCSDDVSLSGSGDKHNLDCTGTGVPAEKIPRNLSSVDCQLGGEYVEGSARLGGDIALPVLR